MSLFEDQQDGRRELTWRGLRTTDQHPRGRWRYTEWATGERELYDLEADPWELENLARSKPKLRRMFGEEVARLAGEPMTGGRSPGPAGPGSRHWEGGAVVRTVMERAL